jgi:hypothetical protein
MRVRPIPNAGELGLDFETALSALLLQIQLCLKTFPFIDSHMCEIFETSHGFIILVVKDQKQPKCLPTVLLEDY